MFVCSTHTALSLSAEYSLPEAPRNSEPPLVQIGSHDDHLGAGVGNRFSVGFAGDGITIAGAVVAGCVFLFA
jgi:hypothetical protein